LTKVLQPKALSALAIRKACVKAYLRGEKKATIFHAEIERISNTLSGHLVTEAQESQGLKGTQSFFCQKRVESHPCESQIFAVASRSLHYTPVDTIPHSE